MLHIHLHKGLLESKPIIGATSLIIFNRYGIMTGNINKTIKHIILAFKLWKKLYNPSLSCPATTLIKLILLKMITNIIPPIHIYRNNRT